MQRLSLKLTILILAIQLIGCSQPRIVIKDEISFGSLGSQASIIIEDRRPQSDKKYSIGSILVTSDEYGIWTLGDDMFEPSTLDILKNYVNRETLTWRKKPNEIKIILKRLRLEANHQADMLKSSSTQLGPLGVAIAESMHGKKFEMNYDKTRPFVLGYLDADVIIDFSNVKGVKKSISAYKAENFSSHVDVEGRMAAAEAVLKALYISFTKSLQI